MDITENKITADEPLFEKIMSKRAEVPPLKVDLMKSLEERHAVLKYLITLKAVEMDALKVELDNLESAIEKKGKETYDELKRN